MYVFKLFVLKNPVSRCEATMHLSSEDLSRNEHISGENRQ